MRRIADIRPMGHNLSCCGSSGWSPKFATGLNVIIGIDQKIYE